MKKLIIISLAFISCSRSNHFSGNLPSANKLNSIIEGSLSKSLGDTLQAKIKLQLYYMDLSSSQTIQKLMYYNTADYKYEKKFHDLDRERVKIAKQIYAIDRFLEAHKKSK